MNAPMSSYPPAPRASAWIGDGGFVPEAVLEGWLRTGEAMRAGATLTFLRPPPSADPRSSSRAALSTRDRGSPGQRYLLRDAIRVLGRRNGETDPYGFTGRVEPIREMIRRGAIVAEGGVRLGPAVYDVEYGFIAVPCASADESGANPRVG
jgi:hypothetical protein